MALLVLVMEIGPEPHNKLSEGSVCVAILSGLGSSINMDDYKIHSIHNFYYCLQIILFHRQSHGWWLPFPSRCIYNTVSLFVYYFARFVV